MLFSSIVSLRTSPARPEEHNGQQLVVWPMAWLGIAFEGAVERSGKGVSAAFASANINKTHMYNSDLCHLPPLPLSLHGMTRQVPVHRDYGDNLQVEVEARKSILSAYIYIYRYIR